MNRLISYLLGALVGVLVITSAITFTQGHYVTCISSTIAAIGLFCLELCRTRSYWGSQLLK